MKKLVCLFVGLAIISACTKTPEERAKALIKDKVKSILIRPESYDPVETVLDSAFTPLDDPAFYEKVLEFCNRAKEKAQYEEDAKEAQTTMSLWDEPYQTSYGRTRYNEAKEKYDDATSKLEKTATKLVELVLAINTEREKEKRFIGFKAKHRYRASSNTDFVSFGEAEFLFDKDVTKIVMAYDMDEDDYKKVHYLFDNWMINDGQTDQ